MDSFWDFFWFSVSLFFFMAYLIVMFQIVADVFRDRHSSGVTKALWIFFLIVLPVLTALVYLVVNGQSMTERSNAAAQSSRQQAEDYIRSVAATSPADQIAQAQGLREAGVINDEEFAQLKARALA